MAFFSVLFALILDLYLVTPIRRKFAELFLRFASSLKNSLSAGEHHHGVVAWCLAVIPAMIVTGVLYWYAYQINPVIAWIMNVLVLYLTVDFKSVADLLTKLPQTLRHDHEQEAHSASGIAHPGAIAPDSSAAAQVGIENALLGVHRGWFAVVFWFLILPGPVGALLYFLSWQLAEHWGEETSEEHLAFGSFARRALEWIDWLPARLTAVTSAIMGNFEDAVYCWRSQATAWPRRNEGVVLASGAGAIGVMLGEAPQMPGAVEMRSELGMGDVADVHSVQSAEGLIWRGVVLWIGLLLLLSLVAWIGD